MSQSWQEWLADQRDKSAMSVRPGPIDALDPWGFDQDAGWYGRSDNAFFRIVGVVVSLALREVKSWMQPLIKELGGDCAVLVVVSNYLDVLVTFKAEPGNTEVAGMGYLAPTLQASWDNLNRAHGGSSPTGSSLVDDQRITWVRCAKDGGRFIGSFNRLGVLCLEWDDKKEDIQVEPNQRWFTQDEVREALMNGECNAHLREVIGLAFI